MLKSECPNCGSVVSAFASSCGACGAPNRARFGAFAVVGSVAALVVAIVFAGVLVLRWQQGAGGGGGTGPADYTWLATAMSDCDAEAQKSPDTLHFLVVPMLSAPSDDAAWKAASLNDIGNGVLLRQRDTLDGLADQSLVISTDQYEFSVRDEKTSAIYKWTPSVGVKKFLVAGGVQIQEFKVQFKTQQRKNENEWGAGAPFVNSKGTCYWVNAIIGH